MSRLKVRSRTSDLGRAAARLVLRRSSTTEPAEPTLEDLIRGALSNDGGQLARRDRAADLAATYLASGDAFRRRFFELLVTQFGVRSDAVDMRIEQRMESSTEPAAVERHQADYALRLSLEPAWLDLFRVVGGIGDGVKFLVDLRADLLTFRDDDPRLRVLDGDLKRLLGDWFSLGLLELRQITWNSEASLLERLSEYEAVHAIEGWSDLKNRLESDRRCFAFFHPSMPGEPLVFVEVALVDGIAGNLQALLDQDAPLGDPTAADTAIFYSISNCQRGLAGVNLGNALIKQVVGRLRGELPNLVAFATLSPLPGFRAWLEAEVASRGAGIFTADERSLFGSTPGTDPLEVFSVATRTDAWADDPARLAYLRPVLLRLAEAYLVTAKRGSQALDRVANFHLSNGARLERINWLANRSAAGVERSYCMMVNYRYVLDDLETNHDRYRDQGEVVTAADFRH